MRGKHLRSLSYTATLETWFPVHKLWGHPSNNTHTIAVLLNQYPSSALENQTDMYTTKYLISQPYESTCLVNIANPLIAQLWQRHNKIISPH